MAQQRSVIHSELTIWLAALFSALTGHETALALIERLDGHPSPTLPYAATAFALFTLAFYASFDNPLPKKLDRSLRRWIATLGAIPWIVSGAAFVALIAFADELHRAIAGNLDPIRFAGEFLLFAVLALLARRLIRGQLLVVHSRYVESRNLLRTGHGAKHLVFFLSDIEPELEENGWLPKEMVWSDSLDDDVAELKRRGIRWRWEMPLRGLRPHRRTLEAITLVCSEQSIRQAGAFADRVRRYPEFEKKTIRVWCEENDTRMMVEPGKVTGHTGFSFDDVNHLSSAVVDLMKYLRFGERVKAHDIMIDFTGGQKTTSIVAAAVTFRGEIRAQYVDTNKPWDTLEYDFVTNLEPKEV